MGVCSQWLALLRIMVSPATMKFESLRVARSCKYLSAGKLSLSDRKYLLPKVDYGNSSSLTRKSVFAFYCVKET